jgi:hypothetical protein
MNPNSKLMKHLILTLLITTLSSILNAQSSANYHEELRTLKIQYEDQQAKLKAQYGEALKRLYNKVDKNTQPNAPDRQAIKDEMARIGVKSDDDWYSGIWDVTIQSGRSLGFGFLIDDKSVTFYDLKGNKPLNKSTTDLAGQYKQTEKEIYAKIDGKLYIFSKHSPGRLKIRYYHSGIEDDKVEEWMGTFVKAQ